MQLKNKTIIVTGASDGIGKQIALRLAKENLKLILIARDKKKLDEVASKIKESGSQVENHICDIKSAEEIKRTIKEISQGHQSIDGLINNAGIWQKLAQLDEISDQEIVDVLQTNLQGLILLTKHVLPLIQNAKKGVIINVSSRSGYSAQAGQSIYTASKYGVRGFTEVLREDLKDSHIRVAGIYQGGTNTNMFKKVGENIPEEKYAKFIPPQELAEVVTFVISRPNYVWLPEVRIESK